MELGFWSLYKYRRCQNGHSYNKIYQNTFTNAFPDGTNAAVITGIELRNVNSKIEIWCNDFENCRFGITVASGSTINTTWQNDLGGSPAVGNTFTGSTDRQFDLYNLSTIKITYHETDAKWATIKENSNPPTSIRWEQFRETNEPTCSDLPCDEWPIGVGMADILGGVINIYPNPVNAYETLTIQMEKPLTGTIIVYDVFGRLERTYDFNETSDIEIKDHNLNPGLHFFIIQHSSGEKASFKLIVKE